MTTTPLHDDKADAEQSLKQFLKLEAGGLGWAARSKKLKAGDVLVAVNGEIFNGDSDMLAARIGGQHGENAENLNEDGDEGGVRPYLLSFWRDGNFFHIIFENRLTAGFEVTGAEETLEINHDLRDLVFAPLESYQNFEVFRDVRKNAAMHATDLEEIATIAPILWMLNHRLYYPMIGVAIAYIVTFVAHWSIFLIAYGLVSIYTKRAQVDLLRSYKLFEDKFFWMVVAEPNEAMARATCKRFIPDLRFQFEPASKAKPQRPDVSRLRVKPHKIGEAE